MTDREKALEAALRDIARQRKTDEMPREDRHNGDFEGACDTMIDVARAALAMPATVNRASWEAGRDAAAYKLSSMCQKCGGEGWLWGNELDVLPDVEGHDDTRYSCDSEVHDYAAAIRNLTPPEDAP
jgi:hypothetical protein